MRQTLLALLCVSVVWAQVSQENSKETQDASPRKEDGLASNPWSPTLSDAASLFDELEAMVPGGSLIDHVMSHADDAARFLLPPDIDQEQEGTKSTQQPEENPKLESEPSLTEVSSYPGQPRRKRSPCLKCMMKKGGFGGGGGGYGGGQQQQQQQQQQQVYVVQQPQQQQPQYHPQPQPQPQYHPQPQPQYHPQPQPQYHPQPQQKPQCSPCGGGHPPSGGGGGGGYSQSSSNSQASSGGYGGGWGK